MIKHGEAIRDEYEIVDNCVSRAGVISLIMNLNLKHLFSFPSGISKNAFKDLLNGVQSLPPVTPTQSWIPISERLPEDGERVLATHLGNLNPKRQVIEHVYENGKFTMGWDMDRNVHSPTFGQLYMGEVVAWMPFPKSYKESEE